MPSNDENTHGDQDKAAQIAAFGAAQLQKGLTTDCSNPGLEGLCNKVRTHHECLLCRKELPLKHTLMVLGLSPSGL